MATTSIAASVKKPAARKGAVPPPDPNKAKEKLRKRIVLALALLLLLLGVMWLFSWSRAAASTARINQAAELGKDPEKRDDYNDLIDNLTEAEKKQLRLQQTKAFQKAMHDKLTAFYQLTPEERAQQLRDQILKEEAAKAARDAQRALNGDGGQGSRRGQNGQGGQGGQGGQNGQGGQGGQGGRGNGPEGGNGPGGPGGGTGQDRDSRHREMVDITSPEDHQLHLNYRMDMASQRAAMDLPLQPQRGGGLVPGGGFPGGFGGGPGGFGGGRRP